MNIDIWSDFACPWCYIGEKRLEHAIAALGMENSVTITPRAFELDPYAADKPKFDAVGRLVDKYRIPPEEALRRIKALERAGAGEGIDFRYMGAQYTNTFNSHRLMKLALSKNDPVMAKKVNFGLFDAYFTKNLRLADSETLVDVGAEAGLEKGEILDMLKSDRFGEDVRADEIAAAERNVRSVPFFAFENGLVLPGAVPFGDFERALKAAGGATGTAHGCGPEGCKI